MDTTVPAAPSARRRSRESLRPPGTALGEWIKARRAAQGINQRELADRAGLSRSYLCDIERGRGTKPSVDTLDSISSALGADRTDLLRVAGILEPLRDPEENSRERKLIAVYRGLNERNQLALESFARFLLSEEQHWVQPKLVGDHDQPSDHRGDQQGPTLFDGVDAELSRHSSQELLERMSRDPR
jgi:transcriptional regulator with XRE-family HTH domain